MNIGFLGFPRLTDVGPFVSQQNIELAQSPEVEKDELGQIVLETAGELGVDRENPSSEGQAEVAEEVAAKIYPDEDPVSRAKRVRLLRCIQNKWAKQWAPAVARKTESADPEDDLEMIYMRFKGCIGITESNVADDERLIPDQFK